MKLKQIIFLTVTVLLSRCAPVELNPLILGEDDCSIPCWSEIYPGVTKKLEAYSIVQNLHDVTRFGVDGPYIYFSYDSKISNRLHIDSEQIVNWIELELEPNELGQLIDKFGEPNYFLITLDSGGCILDILYYEKGISFQGHCKASIVGESWIISPNTKMYSAYFTQKYEQVDEMLLLFFPEERVTTMKDSLRTWDGFGRYPFIQ